MLIPSFIVVHLTDYVFNEVYYLIVTMVTSSSSKAVKLRTSTLLRIQKAFTSLHVDIIHPEKDRLLFDLLEKASWDYMINKILDKFES